MILCQSSIVQRLIKVDKFPCFAFFSFIAALRTDFKIFNDVKFLRVVSCKLMLVSF